MMMMVMKIKMMMFLISITLIFFFFPLYSDTPFVSTPLGHERMIVAYSDGTVSLINDTDTQDVLWSVKTGGPICESHQASSKLNAYIHCGHDLNLYKHNRRKGTVKMVKANDKIDNEMDEFVRLGVVVWSGIRSGVTVIDAHTGCALVRRVEIRDKERDKFFIRREDYELGVKAIIQRNTVENARVIWNARVAEFMVRSHCSAQPSPSCQMGYLPIHRLHIADSPLSQSVGSGVR